MGGKVCLLSQRRIRKTICIFKSSVIELFTKTLIQIMLCPTCSHKGEADTVLALKDLTLVEDKFGMNQKYGKVLWEMGSVYRTHHSFPKGGRYLLGLEVSYSIISSWGQRNIKGRGKTCM